MQNLDVAYNQLGNITFKSDVGAGNWGYDSVKKHQLRAAPGLTFTYDDNGNQDTRNGDPIEWTSYNYPEEIINNGRSHTYSYDGHRSRWRTVYDNGTSTETTISVSGLVEKRTEGTYTEYRHYIKVGGRAVALYKVPITGSAETKFLLYDHQGSLDAVTTESGGNYLSLGYAPFGARRHHWTFSGSPPQVDLDKVDATTDSGYTFQTHLEESSLIHMNGRVLDGLTGRFLSADPYIPDPGLTQAFNRYSYVYNNPLSLTDPSGFDPDDLDQYPAYDPDYYAGPDFCDVGCNPRINPRAEPREFPFLSKRPYRGGVTTSSDCGPPCGAAATFSHDIPTWDSAPDPMLLTLAKLAHGVYDTSFSGVDGYVKEGQTIVDEITGFKAALFVNSESGHKVLAFAGTDGTAGNNWVSNLDQHRGLIGSQYKQANWLATTLYEGFEGDLDFVGHSLGGGLAAASAVWTGGTATVFNAAGLHNHTLLGNSISNGSVTHIYSVDDILQKWNGLSPHVSVPGLQVSVPDGGSHGMGDLCAALGCYD